MKTREEILDIVPKNSKCVEIGVFAGDFSKLIFEKTNPLELYLIDLFEGFAVSGDKNGENMREISLDNSFLQLKKYFNEQPHVHVIKGMGDVFLKTLPDNYLDFVYIDGDHSYEGVKRDLEITKQKVKKGGIIAGHDYCLRFFGVMNAVDEFVQQTNFKLHTTSDDLCTSFYMLNA